MNLGIEIGGTKLQLVLGDETCRIHERRRLNVDAARGAVGIRNQMQRAVRELVAASEIDGVGVGFGGPVDWRTGKICKSHQIEGWSEFDLGQWLRELTGAARVKVDNDANVAALGEALHGAGVNFNPVFYITLGSGVGGGLALDGKIYHGSTPGEAEIGHVRLDRQGTIVESRCSGWAIDSRIRDLKIKQPESALSSLAANANGGEAKFLPLALQKGDPAAQNILNELVQDLAFGLSHVVHLFHPEIIVIGGGLSALGEPLRGGLAQQLGDFVMEAFAPGPKLALAALGEDAVPIGALELANAR